MGLTLHRRLRFVGRAAACAAFSFLAGTVAASAATYYVSVGGNNNNDGLSKTTAFRDIQTAADRTNPGDVVYVMGGTYTSDIHHWHQAALIISRSGAPGKPITYKAYPGEHAVITSFKNPAVWNAVYITGSYIVFQGFEVIGRAREVTLDQAKAIVQKERDDYVRAVANNTAFGEDILTNGNCLTAQNTHHIVIQNNIVHDCSSTGIGVIRTDYFTIKNNQVFNSSWWTVNDSSGINVFLAYNADNSTAYKNFVVYNVSHDNGNTQPMVNDPKWSTGGQKPTDGNGIIIDTNQSTNDGKPYLGRTLVMGNVVYFNGGTGMHAYKSKHVDFFNNTAYLNNKCPVPGSTCGNINNGQILAGSSDDVNIYNNISYSPAGKYVYNSWGNRTVVVDGKSVSTVVEDNNIMYGAGGTAQSGILLGKRDILADPKFFDVGRVGSSFDLAVAQRDATSIRGDAAGLRPLKVSPALDAGTTQLDNGVAFQANGMEASKDGKPFIGALSP